MPINQPASGTGGGGGTGTMTTVEDEGTPVSVAVVSLNFTGGAKASGGPGTVVVDIPGAVPGLLAARPAAADANNRELYYATDEKALYISNGTTWTVVVLDDTSVLITSSAVSDFREAAEDFIGATLTDTATIDLTYTDNAGGVGTISGIIVPGSVGPTQLADTTVVAGSYGSASTTTPFTVDADGRVTAVSSVAIVGLYTITAVKTANYSAAANELVRCDASAGTAFTITLPTAPADKTRVAVKLVAGASGGIVTMATGGGDVFNVAGGATTFAVATPGQTTEAVYSLSLGVWVTLNHLANNSVKINARRVLNDANLTVNANDRLIAVTALTAARTLTLPAANALPGGDSIVLTDEGGVVTNVTNYVIVNRAGADTMQWGPLTGQTTGDFVTKNGTVVFTTDGTSKWTVTALSEDTQSFAATGTFRRPIGCRISEAFVIGPGGGGGGGAKQAAGTLAQGGGGGGAGGVVIGVFATSALAATETVTVGTGGTGGAGGTTSPATGSDGTAGSGSSSLGTLVSAGPGSPGIQGAGSFPGAAGPAGTSSLIVGAGSSGVIVLTTLIAPGNPGHTGGGAGGAAINTSNATISGTFPNNNHGGDSSAGAGGTSGGASSTGGNGTAGTNSNGGAGGGGGGRAMNGGNGGAQGGGGGGGGGARNSVDNGGTGGNGGNGAVIVVSW